MLNLWQNITHLLFPQVCNGCGSDSISGKHLLCTSCHNALHPTNFAGTKDNTVERIFWGRLPVEQAFSSYYFYRNTLLQQLIHAFKYKSEKALGIYMGSLMGKHLQNSRFSLPDVLMPLPLFPDKQHKRGYNQAELLCTGIAEVLGLPVITNCVHRIKNTTSQTFKTRLQRWKNVEGVFWGDQTKYKDAKHILLVDDVVTTGATLEACGHAILEDLPDVTLSIATLAYALD